MHYLQVRIAASTVAATPQIGRVLIRPRRVLASQTARVNLTGTHNTMFKAVLTSQATVVQAFAVDPVGGHMYASQIMQAGIQLPGESAPVPWETREAAGDIAITQMSLATNQVLGVMYITGAGHGAGLGVERAADGTWLWCDADTSGSGFARAIGRVKFQNGAVLAGKTIPLYRPFGAASGSHGLSCAIDPTYNRIMVRRTYPDPGNGRRHYLYDLTAFKAGNFTPLAIVDQEANSTSPDGRSIGTYQGGGTWGNYLYSLEGNPKLNNSYLTSLDWRTGQVVQRALITTHMDLEPVQREPEAIAIWAPNPATPQTVKFGYGFAGGANAA
ncbi:hypothetical protein, partial [Streptomyces sp. NPDC056670]|uniref:phage baseplate protein n=1 Tax=Streptomyces sp. NPDC056670 TaxID=3345904 RepID=UPI00369C94B7